MTKVTNPIVGKTYTTRKGLLFYPVQLRFLEKDDEIFWFKYMGGDKSAFMEKDGKIPFNGMPNIYEL